MPREIDPYDFDRAMRALRRIASAECLAVASSIAKAALYVIEGEPEEAAPEVHAKNRTTEDL